jgi:hypothetical protein
MESCPVQGQAAQRKAGVTDDGRTSGTSLSVWKFRGVVRFPIHMCLYKGARKLVYFR